MRHHNLIKLNQTVYYFLYSQNESKQWCQTPMHHILRNLIYQMNSTRRQWIKKNCAGRRYTFESFPKPLIAILSLIEKTPQEQVFFHSMAVTSLLCPLVQLCSRSKLYMLCKNPNVTLKINGCSLFTRRSLVTEAKWSWLAKESEKRYCSLKLQGNCKFQ